MLAQAAATLLAAILLAAAPWLPWAGCPGGALSLHDRCWILGSVGATCGATCAAKGLGFAHYVAGEGEPMVPKLLGKQPSNRQFAWGRLECYVPGSDRFHTAKERADSNTGDQAEPQDWSVDVCRMACPCTQGASAPAAAADPGAPFPHCIEEGTVLRHAGAHAIFGDLSTYGSTGCWQNDCKNTDKFNCDDPGLCARACAQTDECTHWTMGDQEDVKKCFLRKSDAGKEMADGWHSAVKMCSPPQLSDAFVAFRTAEVLKPCDAGKSDACPDMARAVNTWRFAIKHLKKATEGRVDPSTISFINQICDDTDAFAAQMSEDNFPVVVGNNRQIMNALHSFLASAAPGHAVDPEDKSLPGPLRGRLCHASSCYGEEL